jgi:hypothetical protein
MVETIILLIRALRKIVIFRYQDSYRHSILPSLIATVKKQDKHPIGFFKTLFPEDWLPIKKIYNNSFQMAHLIIAS